jgi:hypothetical protein
VGSSQPVQPRVVRFSEVVRQKDPCSAGEDEVCRPGCCELLEEWASLTCADFHRFRDVHRCLSLSYNPNQYHATKESSILSHMSSSENALGGSWCASK